VKSKSPGGRHGLSYGSK